MSKYFTLLSNEEVRSAPDTKVIPSKEFSTLKKASEILAAVEKEALEYKKEVSKEAEEMKELGFQAGFEEGLDSFNKHLLLLDQELKKLRTDVQERILPLAIGASKKIMGEELKLHPDRVVEIVMNSLKPVTQHRKVSIYVNKNDLQQVESSKPKIKKLFERLENLSIQERDDIEPGGCIIETEAGIINAQLENQWRSLERAFKTFMKK